MNKLRLIAVCFITMFLFVKCSEKPEDTPTPELAEEVKVFLNDMIDKMKTNSINKEKIDWNNFTESVFKEAGTAKNITEAEPAIKLALVQLGDNHSFYLSPESKRISGSNLIYTQNTDQIGEIPKDIGYVKVQGFAGSTVETETFANNIQKTIKDQDKSSFKGWIVDLRGNSGGNMWPMIAGLGPILGEEVLGYFIDPKGNEIEWSYKKGSSMIGTSIAHTVKDPYVLINKQPKVAVLINSSVASSGEATAISFKGRKNTLFFGSPTFGLSTANQTYMLTNNGNLYLTVTTMADRSKTKYGGRVGVDNLSYTATETNSEAIKWLSN